jgi:hypothetical protein
VSRDLFLARQRTYVRGLLSVAREHIICYFFDVRRIYEGGGGSYELQVQSVLDERNLKLLVINLKLLVISIFEDDASNPKHLHKQGGSTIGSSSTVV